MDGQSHPPARTNKTCTVNIFHHNADNIGDRLCGPAQYFWPELVENASFKRASKSFKNVILGGGQVFGQLDSFSRNWTKSQSKTLVAWGVGLPVKGKNDAVVHEVSTRFSLFGTRNYDWRDSFRFVPCTSCMSPFFDTTPAPKHDVVVYAHRRKTPSLLAPEGVPFLTNHGQDISKVIEFLSHGETVVTSSYHGVYWAQLLGRKVICIPYNDKFSTFQHIPTMATAQTWQAELALATRTEPMLDEYRSLNQSFASKVAQLLDIGG